MSQHRGKYPQLGEFRGTLPFEMDPFQIRGCEVLESGRSVLVAAPTGAGKTIVGEFAAFLALASSGKCFYTTPIKALSNQKYGELVDSYGSDKVGLLTGDNSINPNASIVVMTTEVLRNMLYAGSSTLLDLQIVVLDEVHYLADRARGAVWEEVIIHLPESVSIAALSATVSNAEEFGDWLVTVRGETVTIVEERRPVPLYQHVVVGNRMYDLFVDEVDERDPKRMKVNPELIKVARDDWASRRMRDRRSPRGRPNSRGADRAVGNGRRVWVPNRIDVVERLERRGLLPAIVFIFSRAGCDAAVQQCLNANLRLTTPAERDKVVAMVEERCAELPADDLQVLGYLEFLDGLSRGVAAHHAGLLPLFKECVEDLFAQGLCKVVFATDTLALGVNMPAKSVVLEKLSKWNGETHADITPGEYTQLTGRAGRRGIDVEGHGVVLWQPGMDPNSVAGLASTRTYPLKSSFRPTYNMAVNLVAQVGRDRARQLLESSFAQFQADRAVVGLAQQLRKSDEALEGYSEAATCSHGDFMDYARLRHRLKELETRAAKERRSDRRDDVISSLAVLRRGDVIKVPSGRFAGYAVVLDPGQTDEREGPRVQVLTSERQARRLSLVDFQIPVSAVDRMRIPRTFNPRNPQSRRDLAQTLRTRVRGLVPDRGRPTRPSRDPEIEDAVSSLRANLRSHPCHDCPDREDHARWAERWFRLDRDARNLQKRIDQRTNTIARRFDRICEVLLSLGYLQDIDGSLSVTNRGQTLMRIHTDMDLLVAESLSSSAWSNLDACGLAALVSSLVYEARKPENEGPPEIPTRQLNESIKTLNLTYADLLVIEREHKLDQVRPADPGLMAATHRWAQGDELDDVLDVCDLPAGDFVRWMKQTIDLCGQIIDATRGQEIEKTAQEAISLIRRGVVSQSSLID